MTQQSPGPDDLRAGNADREQVVSRLNTAFAEGRLEIAELDERIAAVYAAKTIGELRPLTADLPPPAGSVQPFRPRDARSPARTAGGEVRPADDEAANARRGVAGSAGVVAINVLIWGIISADGEVAYFWPVWLLIPLALSIFRAIAVSHRGGGHER
jgi:hypothetical protein